MDEWVLVYDDFQKKNEPLHESLTTLGNGYFATRGAAEESQADDIHYPGVYLAGGYNRLESLVAERSITNEDLVNFPNWLSLVFRIEEGHWFNLQTVDILSYRKQLNLREGVLQRTVHFSDYQGRETVLDSRRIVHMGNPHYAAIEYKITAINWSGPIEIKSALDGSVINTGVARYRELNLKHLKVLDLGEINEESIYLKVETTQSQIRMAQVARHHLYDQKSRLHIKPELIVENESIAHQFSLILEKNNPIRLEKIVSLYTSRDRGISECLLDAKLSAQHAGDFTSLLFSHRKAWEALWDRCDVEIKSNSREQLILRLHIFHLLQSVSLHSVDADVGVPARGLHGEAYRGHIFWDELFIFPFYMYRIPEIARSLLLYRYHRLNMARRLAREAGFQGAMYPWQSGSNGQEETQIVHMNPRTNSWGPDYSRYQYHVNVAIVYNIWQYYLATNNIQFMSAYGAEMIFEICRFWSSVTQFDQLKGRYEIHGVMGPDEYHEKYPNTDEPGLKNNAYTNVMVVWVMEKALELIDQILEPDRKNELIDLLNISKEEILKWREITKKMTIPFHDDGIISQFEGYEQLEEFNWDEYLIRYEGNIERLDRILKSEGDSPDKYKVSKQADVLMLFYLLSPHELKHIFNQLGYPFTKETIRENIEYYEKRTSHGSTLSKVVFASELDQIDRDASRACFKEALESDVSDVQSGATPEGIHLGAMSGTVDIVMRRYAGIIVRDGEIAFNPTLPADIQQLKLKVQHRGHWYHLTIHKNNIQLMFDSKIDPSVHVKVFDRKAVLKSGVVMEFEMP